MDDVFVLALSFCSHINANLYFHTAKGRESQITDLSKLHSHFGQEKCDALVGLHPFSGCDTVSALYGVGKLKHTKNSIKKKNTLTYDLYGLPSQEINKARATLFKSGRYSERDLPLHVEIYGHMATLFKLHEKCL